jgi:hypothetical protein
MEVGQPVWIRKEANGAWISAYIANRAHREPEGFVLGIQVEEESMEMLNIEITCLMDDLEDLKVR